MKILFLDFMLPYLLKDNEYPVGGYAVELSNWIKGLKETDSHVGILSWEGANEHAGKPTDFEIIDTYDPNKGIKVIKYFYLFIPKLLKGAKRFQPDVIIQGCAGVSTFLMAFVSKRCNVPFVYRVANDMDVDGRFRSRMAGWESKAYEYGLGQASAIVCQNEYQMKCLREQYPEKQLYKIHNPYDTEKAIANVKPRDERTYIAWLGVFQKQKNLPLLLKLAKSLPSIPFRIAGMPEKIIDEETETAITELEKLPNVTFIGYVKRTQILDFLSNAICLVSTSHYEGFSNTFLESFAAGTPVVCPSRVDPDGIIDTHGLGYASPEDENLTTLLNQLFDMNSDEYNTLSEHCSDYLQKNFSPATKAQDLVGFLDKIIPK